MGGQLPNLSHTLPTHLGSWAKKRRRRETEEIKRGKRGVFFIHGRRSKGEGGGSLSLGRHCIRVFLTPGS